MGKLLASFKKFRFVNLLLFALISLLLVAYPLPWLQKEVWLTQLLIICLENGGKECFEYSTSLVYITRIPHLELAKYSFSFTSSKTN